MIRAYPKAVRIAILCDVCMLRSCNTGSSTGAEMTPFYINGEYLLECASEMGGQDIETLITRPVLASEDTPIFVLVIYGLLILL